MYRNYKHKLYYVQLLNKYFYIRTKSDLYEEFIITKKPPTVTEYESNLIEYMNRKQERRNHYCKVHFVFYYVIIRFVQELLINLTCLFVIVVVNHSMNLVVIQ